ncbi:MAG: asparagine synthase (glutamine-hydrolyzing) [Nitrospirota bacterium]|jgi:asparagine synthase (glutamine-hydrolysing)|nr:asparagine synthase (glutamine-hydrolyzing) [Nitrospirota bacterium]
MCGIAGIVKYPNAAVEKPLLQRMIGLVNHRGPDAAGFHLSGPVGLAHARLSIIDVGGGHQPMHNEDKTVWITFNGEIFNYVELREDLIKKGHRFQTQSDTEVIVHLYEEKGEECVHDLNGQWAFAIWDSRRERLFLSRDRLGVRPLFYAQTPEGFVFGSEIKSLLVVPSVSRAIDRQALDELFTFWVTLPPRTIFEGVSELPPGHSIILEHGDLQIKPYWTLDYNPSKELMQEEEAREGLFELLLDAVRIRLRADVPVGAYLSGGLDSTVIAALVKKLGTTHLKTFSIAFEDKEFDESSFQNEASQFLGTDHQGVLCSSQDIGRVFPEVIWHTEKPVLRTAPAPLFLLSKLVREQGYKVVLTGEGSDEILGGYDIFKEAKIRRFWAKYPDSKFRPMLLRRLYPYMKNIQSQSDAYLRAFFHVRKEDVESPFFSHLPRWDMTSKLKVFYSKATADSLKSCNAMHTIEGLLPSRYGQWDHFSQSQYLEAAHLLPGYILSSQGDRMAMAHSIEGRFPFLDYRVVEFASRLSPQLKMKVLNEKYLLKAAIGDMIPRSIRNRHKQPYRAPDSQSFLADGKEGKLFEYVEELLAPRAIQEGGVFDAGAVGKLLEKARQGQIVSMKDNMALVGVLSTQVVIDRFIKNFPRSV